MRANQQPGGHTRGLAWGTTVALVLTAVLPVLMVGGLATTGLQRALTDRATSDLSLLAEAQAGRLDLIGDGAATNARLIASRTQLRRDLAALLDGDAQRLARIGDILADTVQATPAVLAVILLDVDGVVLAGREDPALVDAASAIVDLDLADADAVASVLVEEDALDRWLVLTPLHLDDRVLGAALVELDLAAVVDVVAGAAAGGARAQTCVYHVRADGSLAPLRVAEAGAAECDTGALPAQGTQGPAPGEQLASMLLASVEGAIDGRDAAGERILASGRQIRATQWLVLVRLPRDELLAPVRPTTTTLAAAVLVIALLAGAFAVVLARRLTGPIGGLAHTVRAIGDGDLAARATPDGPGELGDLATGVNRMADAIEREAQEREQRYRDLEALTHAMAHDLKGPLTTVHGMLELVADDRVTDPQQRVELLDRARGASVRMQRMIADLLTLVRAHGAPFERRPVDLEELIDATADDLGASEVIERESLPTVPGDRILLEHVAQNLLSNAVTYHPPGMEPRVVISSTRTDDAVEIRIDDAGVGIPEAEREEVLELFVRGERTRQTRGTGLGLPIAVRAVDRHGGRVRIEDSPLGGTRMVVCLPMTDTVDMRAGSDADGVRSGGGWVPQA